MIKLICCCLNRYRDISVQRLQRIAFSKNLDEIVSVADETITSENQLVLQIVQDLQKINRTHCDDEVEQRLKHYLKSKMLTRQ